VSINACLAQLTQSGAIDRERAARFKEEYDRLNREYGRQAGAAADEEHVTQLTMQALDYQLRTQRRQAMLQVDTQRRILTDLVAHIDKGGKAGQFAISLMEHHEAVWGGAIGVENRRAALYRLAWSRMDGFLGRYGRDMLGRVRNGDELTDVVRELRGEGTGNASAAEMARAVADTLEWLRREFNMAGGDIAKLDGWGLPQSHDALEIGKAGFEAWRDFIKPMLDPTRMVDKSTGKAFASDAALDDALEAVWRNITSEGMDGQIPGAFTGQGKVASRRTDHRFLVFKDADAWLGYNERFGMGDALDGIVSHIDSMTRDIASMQSLGPNPAQTIRWLGDMLRQDALPTMADGKRPRVEAAARKGADTLQNMWDYYSGALTAVPPEYRGQARFFSGLRNWNVMSKLGSAFISALPTDPVFAGITAKFNGLPVSQVLYDYARLFNPADASHRALAEHAGLIFSEMTPRAERLWREGRKLNLHEFTRRGADGLLRASLLSPHTVAMKQSLGLGFMKDWGEAAGRSFDSLDPADRLALGRYGIDAADWDRLRAVGIFDQDGTKMLRPGDLARIGDRASIETATKFMALIDSETRFGVPGESLRASTAVATIGNSLRLQRGTIGGELLHSATQFKTYSVIMMMTHMQRALYGQGGMDRAAYAIALPTLLTLGGLSANWMLDIFNGKDPSPITSEVTWGRAFVRGGGLGIIGDIISEGLSGQHGATGAATGFVVGPTMSSLVDPAIALTFGNIGQAASGKETNLSSELVSQARKLTPGSNLWYTRAAFNRMWADQLQQWADPNYRQSFRRLERTAREQGTDYWWAPGEFAPDRAPEISNVAGE
jgi:hypothetical protein